MTRVSASRLSASRLKAKLGAYLRLVRGGREIVITDRGHPVARLVPFQPAPAPALVIAQPRDPAAPPLGKMRVECAVRLPPGVNSTQLLREDRDKR